jgi:hypothetical protein
VIADAKDTSITLPGLKNNVTYEAIVRAVNAVGVGAVSAPVRVTPLLPGGPTSPVGVKVTLGATKATVPSGGAVILSGLVTRNGDPQQGMKVRVTFKGADKVKKVIGTVTTDTFGGWQLTAKPGIKGAWVAEVTSVAPAVTSESFPIQVTAVVKGVKSRVANRAVTVTGLHAPALKLSSKVRAPKLQVQIVDSKGKIKKVLVTGNARQATRSGNPFTLVTKPLAPGTYRIRVVSLPTFRLASGITKSFLVTVR